MLKIIETPQGVLVRAMTRRDLTVPAEILVPELIGGKASNTNVVARLVNDFFLNAGISTKLELLPKAK